MSFLQNLFSRKAEASFDEKKDAFIAALLKIEEKYTEYFNTRLQKFSSGLPEQLQNHFLLSKEFEYIRLDYKPDSDLPAEIRQDCDAAYQKVWGNN